ncbi:TonB-dependent receptor [Sphingomonas colocasiae]|uniref:TonB-dependent receptor n=1 Tax=Sphingomonas colocasiae TaxID=1848973 RepID=A0ABS7PHZ3_9SPHN|nr:TonB-dependent receptor [Sphingomonas colocasiae]MBY8820843.1 TonB-dependent receptor [Sphingomonas colocasiae]
MTHKMLWMAGTAMILAGGQPAFAQVSADSAEPVNMGDIIVTAQRRAEAINDIGMAIQAFDAESLTALRVTSVKDLTTVAPSFTVSQSYQGVPTYTLRGIGFNTINLSATSTVGTYVDEVAYAYPIMNTGPMMDLERVELLKGPQGTLYGRNTTAGLVNLITAKPTETFEARVAAELGNYETYNFEGVISGPIAPSLGVRVSFRSENSDKGWQRSNARGERLGEIEKHGVRVALKYEPSIDTNIDLSWSWWRNRSDTVAGQGIGFTPATDPANPAGSNSRFFNAPGLAAYIAANQPGSARDADWAPYATRSADIGTGLGLDGPLRENNRFHGLKLRIDQALSDDIKLVSLTSYNDFKRNALSDWSGVPYEILLQNTVGRIRSFAEDIHLEGESGPVTWLVGAYYARDRILDSNRTLLGQNANVGLIRAAGQPLLATPFNCCGYTAAQLNQAFRTYEDIGRIRTTTWSVFANADWKISDRFKLNAGIRYTEDKQRYSGCSRDFNGNMLPNVNVVNRALYFQNYGKMAAPIAQGQCNTFDPVNGTFGEINSLLDEDNVSWRVSADWTPSDDTLFYASVSRGAKSGTTPINAANLARQNAPVKQELLTAYELGLKASLAGRALQANLSAFYYDYKNKQISTYFADPIYTALSRLDNVPKSEAYGVEGELNWRPSRAVTVAATALWLHTEVKRYLGTNAAGQPQDFAGAEFIYSPDFQGSLSVIVDQPISDSLNLQATLNGRYQSKSNTIFEDLPLYKIPGYGVVNGSIGIAGPDDKWSVSLWARNLFDKYYWTAVASNANVVVRFASPPRTFGATLAVRF